MFRRTLPTQASTVFWRGGAALPAGQSGVYAARRASSARNPNTRLVIDHLGLPQPHVPPAPEQPFAALPHLLALAAHDNIAVKISGACTLSHEPFPYKDLWDALGRVFSFNRCMWAPTGPERSRC
jgi:predicted TIM-barrel fold metal-dependent hydrolase